MSTQLPNNLDAIVHIGAGKCQELESYLATNTKRIVLVEPIPALAEELRKKVKNEPRVEVIEIAVGSGSESTLHQFNLIETSSLYLPTGLKSLFPGIKIVQEHSVVVEAAEVFIGNLNLEGSRNGLILQAPGAESLMINALNKSQKLGLFSFIKVTGSEESLYSSNNIVGLALELVGKEGYELDNKSIFDSDWVCWQFSRNPLQQPFNELTGQHKIITESLLQTQSELNNEKATKGEYKLQLSEEKSKLVGLQKTLKETQAQLALSEQELQLASKQLESNSVNNDNFKNLEEKLNSLSSNITNHMDKKLHNTSRQLESFMGLQGYLEHGDMPLSYHGWPISPDIALFLIEKIESNNYDLIIEFGSGTSTALFAKTVLNRSLKNSGHSAKNKLLGSQGQQELAHTIPSNDDLPKRVVTFEHNKNYHKKTQALLSISNLEQVVELVHAPLVDYNYKGDDYLYYACDATLERISKMFEGREAKILVLVDGPPGGTGPLARFPALPKLLNTLSTHSLHVIMDDTNRQDEKDIVKKWGEILSTRGLSFKQHSYGFEKGAILMEINGES